MTKAKPSAKAEPNYCVHVRTKGGEIATVEVEATSGDDAAAKAHKEVEGSVIHVGPLA